MTSLFVQSQGEGPDLVLLHGWGMHAGIWHDVVARLQRRFRLHCVDLPGHGRSPLGDTAFTLGTVVQQVVDALQARLDRAHWLGWSLGGMVATQLAQQHAGLVKSLSLVACNLRFCRSEDWPCAMSPEVLQKFADNLTHHPEQTLQRFLALQVSRDGSGRAQLRQLRQQVFDGKPPQVSALQGGLQILRSADLRALAAQVQQPVWLLGGGQDRLVPPEAQDRIAALFPQAEVHCMAKAGHAPFVADGARFVGLLEDFLQHAEHD